MSNETYDVAILIGNSDDKLTQIEWRDFVTEIKYVIDSLSVRTHFFGGPENYAPWQNACAVFEIYTRHLPILEEKITRIRTEFKQESAAILVGTTRLI